MIEEFKNIYLYIINTHYFSRIDQSVPHHHHHLPLIPKSCLVNAQTYSQASISTSSLATTPPMVVKSILTNSTAAPPLIAVTPSLSMEEDEPKTILRSTSSLTNRRASRPMSPSRIRQDMLRRRSVEPLVHIYSNV